MSTNKSSRIIPVVVAVSVVAGIVIGIFYASYFPGNRLGVANISSNKLDALLGVIENQYVDTVDMHELVEDAMPMTWVLSPAWTRTTLAKGMPSRVWASMMVPLTLPVWAERIPQDNMPRRKRRNALSFMDSPLFFC